MLASRFASRSPVLRSDTPLSDDQIRAVVPSIYADAPHGSRSERYSYIPTAAVLTELRKEGFQPFMVTQTCVRNEDRREHTKHMIRLRHANQVNDSIANEIILLNSHDGSSSYQMLAGAFRFVCSNGLVCGDTVADVRIPHKGDVAGRVNHPGNRGGCFVKVKQVPQLVLQIVDSNAPPLRPAGYHRSIRASVGG